MLYYLGWPINPLGPVQSNWTGNWTGLLKTFSDSIADPELLVTLEIRPHLMVENNCTTWRNTYSENETLQLKKNYRFCQG